MQAQEWPSTNGIAFEHPILKTASKTSPLETRYRDKQYNPELIEALMLFETEAE